ncbi:MAG: transporter substrate-binding domain-containing protein [Eubacterium sp.]|nr:transporter substrate-binding domain-containing protein [Eubacterium sp.]MDY5496747.1 transporter substrate-binding domain-containing protein [Anaerobutyricum sp.]
MKKKLSIILALTMACTLLVACGKTGEETTQQKKAEKKELIVAMELAYPPFETKDEKGNPSGVSVDFSKDFGKYIGRDVRIENISWDGLIPSLETGKADMVISSMTITEERKKSVDFSDPYANAMLAVLAGKNSGVTKVEDLNQPGKKIAVKTGSTGYIYAQKHLTKAEVVGLPDESACVTEVAQGKADGFIYDQLTIYRNWKKNPDTTTAIFIPFQDVEQWGVAVQKGNTELLNQLNEFIAKYKKEGGFDKLTQKYLSEEKEAFDQLGFQWFFDMKE